MSGTVELRPYFAPGERYPSLIGVRVDGDEHETAYVSKAELIDALDENKSLRELVKDIYASVRADEDNCDVSYVEQFEGRMRELGIEAKK